MMNTLMTDIKKLCQYYQKIPDGFTNQLYKFVSNVTYKDIQDAKDLKQIALKRIEVIENQS